MKAFTLIEYLRAATGTTEMEHREYRLRVIALCDLAESLASKIDSLEAELEREARDD